MVRKEDIVKVPIEWPENKPARLATKGSTVCPRSIKDPRNCEICPWFAGYYDVMSRNIEFMQRWLGTGQRRVAFVQCGAPAEIKKPVEKAPEDGVVVGLSQDSPEYEKALKKQVAADRPSAEPESPEAPPSGEVPVVESEPEEAVL